MKHSEKEYYTDEQNSCALGRERACRKNSLEVGRNTVRPRRTLRYDGFAVFAVDAAEGVGDSPTVA